MRRRSPGGTVLAWMVVATLLGAGPAFAHGDHVQGLAGLKRTLLVCEDRKPLHLPALVTTSGASFSPERRKGHWTVIYVGFTTCPDVCPTTLRALSVFAGDPANGVAKGTTQIEFVSIDPEHDTPVRLQAFLTHFDGRIRGLTGTPATITRFTDEIGAAFRATGQQFDHSTSLFVLDPVEWKDRSREPNPCPTRSARFRACAPSMPGST